MFNRIPAAKTGEGDTVEAIPRYKGTTRAAFIVNIGYENTPGPRQLIEFYIAHYAQQPAARPLAAIGTG